MPGSVEMTTDEDRIVSGNLEMDAYGDMETATGNLQWGQTPYRYIGGLNCQSEGLANFGGTGGGSYRLIMMGERWYDPQVGRFISRDPVFSENLYAYCGNDPVNAVDPEGRWTVGFNFNLVCWTTVGPAKWANVGVVIGNTSDGDVCLGVQTTTGVGLGVSSTGTSAAVGIAVTGSSSTIDLGNTSSYQGVAGYVGLNHSAAIGYSPGSASGSVSYGASFTKGLGTYYGAEATAGAYFNFSGWMRHQIGNYFDGQANAAMNDMYNAHYNPNLSMYKAGFSYESGNPAIWPQNNLVNMLQY